METRTAASRVTLRFTSEGPGTHAFTPLVPTGAFTVEAHDVDVDALDLLDLSFEARLHAGTVEVPLVAGESFPLEVPDGCRAAGAIRATRVPGGEGRPECRVASAGIAFDPPLVLHHVVPLLARLGALFEDRDLSDLLARVNRSSLAGRVGPRLRRLLPPGGPGRARIRRLGEDLVASSRQAVQVHLSEVQVHPMAWGDTWALDLRFTGTLEVFGRTRVRFQRVRVPTPVLPAPFASLRRLLSGDPLASAILHRDRVPVEGILRALVTPLAGLSGRVEARADLPALAVECVLPDGTKTRAAAAAPGSATLRARLEGGPSAGALRVAVEEARVDLPTGRLEARAACEARRVGSVPPEPTFVAMAAAGRARGAWPGDRVRLHLEVELLPGSRLEGLHLALAWDHPLLLGGGTLALGLTGLGATGRFCAELAPETGAGLTRELILGFQAGFALGEGSRVDDGLGTIEVRRLEGRVEGRLEAGASDEACLDLRGEAELDVGARRAVGAFPELDVEAGDLAIDLQGHAAFAAGACTRRTADDLVALDLDGTSIGLDLDRAEARLGSRRLHLPRGARIDARVAEAWIDTSGLGRSRFDVDWDLHGASAVLDGPGGSAHVLVEALRKGSFTLSISPAGGVSVSGEPGGLYDARYVNALVNPLQEGRRWLELLDDEEAFDHVLAAATAFGGGLARHLERARALARRVRHAVRSEGIREPGDLLPAPVLARVLSRILTGRPDLEARLLPHVHRANRGDGLDVPGIRRILDEVLPPHALGWEIDRGLRLLARVLAPTEPVPPLERREILPLAERPRWRRRLAALPPAGEIYAVLSGAAPLPEGFPARLARVAPYLTLEQASWVLEHLHPDLGPADVARLRFVHALKRRCRMIAESAGGLGDAPQATAIGLFLGATVRRRPLPGEPDQPLPGEPEGLLPRPTCLLGPQEVAVLLEAGLSAPLQGRAVQLNQRLLLDLVLAQPPGFLRQVLVAMGRGSPRILAGKLNGLIDLVQDRVRTPLDVPALLSERLGTDLPRRGDFLAGGRFARRSWSLALNRATERILAWPEAGEALRTWIQVARHPVPAPPTPAGPLAALEARARRALARADRLGARCRFREDEPAQRRAAGRAYEAAYAACAALLDAEPRMFQCAWFKSFFARSHEALVVLSVVRDVQGDVDRTPEWLASRLGAPVPRDEQDLLDAVIGVLYDDAADRAALRADPLVRLLWDPPPGRYDFTVVSCMGVITEGSRGTELEGTFRRLEARRGVRVIRADTGTVRSLDVNAERIEEAARRVRTPWGYFGYSQGCANGLLAETRLLGGTPDQQALASSLRCRHFLFPAINGSAHGTSGDLKFLRVLIDAEHALSRYRAVLSPQAVLLGLHGLQILLGSKVFARTLGGVESLSRDGVLALGRECQLRAEAPTTLCRGRVRPEVLPDALEFLASQLTHQIGTDAHDTQIAVSESVGSPVHLSNPSVRLAEACDVGARVQTAHHWSPLREMTAFVTTARDRERCVYEMPKDRHIFPWIEVNARFGVIRPAGSR